MQGDAISSSAIPVEHHHPLTSAIQKCLRRRYTAATFSPHHLPLLRSITARLPSWLRRKERRRGRDILPLAIIAAAYVALLLPYLRFIPFWDGAAYFLCVTDAVRADVFSLTNFHCAGHLSTVYLLLLGVTQYLDLGNITPVHLVNMLIGLGGIWGVSAILRSVHNGDQQHDAVSLWLTTAIYAVMPLSVAHVLHVNLDFPVLSFFAIFLACLLRRYRTGAILAGVAMIFSKETGAAIYIATSALFILFQVVRLDGTLRDTGRKMLRLTYLAIPGAILVGYYSYFRFTSSRDLTWSGSSPQEALSTALNFNLANEGFRALLLDIFVLNFHWIPSAAILAFLLHRTFALLTRRHDAHGLSPEARRLRVFSFLLLLAAAYVVTRIRPWNNARYVLAAYMPLIVCFSVALQSLLRSTLVKRGILVGLLLLVFASNFRTIDPVSRAVYGTFRFGSHTMLDMSKMIGPRWSRRDQLVYNLEFTKLFQLERHIFAAIRPTRSTVILTGAYGVFLLPPYVDDTSFEPTLRHENSIPLQMIDALEDMTPKRLRVMLEINEPFTFIEYPIFDNTGIFSYLTEHYPLIETRTYDVDGYTARLHTFVFHTSAL